MADPALPIVWVIIVLSAAGIVCVAVWIAFDKNIE
jgi:hypothetical protein